MVDVGTSIIVQLDVKLGTEFNGDSILISAVQVKSSFEMADH